MNSIILLNDYSEEYKMKDMVNKKKQTNKQKIKMKEMNEVPEIED